MKNSLRGPVLERSLASLGVHVFWLFYEGCWALSWDWKWTLVCRTNRELTNVFQKGHNFFQQGSICFVSAHANTKKCLRAAFVSLKEFIYWLLPNWFPTGIFLLAAVPSCFLNMQFCLCQKMHNRNNNTRKTQKTDNSDECLSRPSVVLLWFITKLLRRTTFYEQLQKQQFP